MNCSHEAVELMHKYLDHDLTKEEEGRLRVHLEDCEACQKHFHELERTIKLVQNTEQITAPADFKKSVMQKLPAEKKNVKYLRWFKAHPVLTSAVIFVIFMFSGMFSSWNQSGELVVSKQENLEIQGDTVIVPEGVTVEGDLLVKNGDLRIDGTVDGDVRLVNGDLIKDDTIEGSGLMASAGEVNGDLQQVDQVFEWLWFHMKDLIKSIFSLGHIQLTGT
ncbi:zf-HC2 domain-containing protein [Lentibacillus salicampi]|uniref:Anti-sigma-W factor RsiW n=1 Tax=Lentibacillus salicampi TaxID=175306 RepID=A0A4Y9A954_9BACI|nr:zf-HC2 domain-containing protein [Lentibacillus salicampi]TFJ92389.1 anti-sigma factor [Lentibacillus salicampi]